MIVRRRLAALLVAVLSLALPAGAAEHSTVTWHPAKPHAGDVTWIQVKGTAEATLEGSLGPRTLTFFPYAGGHAAVECLLCMHDGAQPEPCAAGFIGGRVAVARDHPALAVLIQHRRDAARPQRDDHARLAAVRA